MSLANLVDEIRSGVVNIVYMKDGIKLGSGSGFMVNGYLVTNHHVFLADFKSEVIVRTIKSDPEDIKDGLKMSYLEWHYKLKSGSPENQHDYAILDIENLRSQDLYNFSFSSNICRIGDQIAFLGYPFGGLNLVCHSAAR